MNGFRNQAAARSFQGLIIRFAVWALIFSFIAWPVSASAETAADRTRYMEAYQLINQLHVSGQQVDADKYNTIDELIGSLGDPYSVYFTEEELRQFTNSVDLNYPGIGMRMTQDEGGYIVIEVFADSPAEAAGLKRGDYIVGINGTKTTGLALHEVSAGIRGPEGTSVALTINRAGNLVEIKAVRQTIRLPVVSGTVLDGEIGYVSVSSFSDDADEMFGALLTEMKKNGIKGLVIDMRDNPGGFLESARQMARQFVPEGILIHTSDKNKEDNPVAFNNGTSVSFPVVILVNENSASASEVLAGALQDYEKALLVGKKTYGKGSVQALYELNSGGVLKLTVQEYLTPNKRVVNLNGIEPDVVVEGTVAQLIAALRHAGLHDFRLELNKHAYRLNGLELFDDTPFVAVDGISYVQARTLAELVGEPLQWNDQLQGVELGTGETVVSFAPGSGFRNIGGTGFIELDVFKSRYPQLIESETEGGIVLSVKGSGQ